MLLKALYLLTLFMQAQELSLVGSSQAGGLCPALQAAATSILDQVKLTAETGRQAIRCTCSATATASTAC